MLLAQKKNEITNWSYPYTYVYLLKYLLVFKNDADKHCDGLSE